MKYYHVVFSLLILSIFIGCVPRSYTINFSEEKINSTIYSQSFKNDSIKLTICGISFPKTWFSGSMVDLTFQISYDDTLADRLSIDLEKAWIQYNNTILSSEDYHKNPYPIKTDTSFHDQLLFGKKINKMEYELDENMVYIFLSEAILLDNKEFIKEKIVGIIDKK